MKKLLFILALAALCGSVFANNISDPEVTLTGWQYNHGGESDSNISDLGDGKGFTVTGSTVSAADYNICYRANNISGWLFNKNEPIIFEITESDFAGSSDEATIKLTVYGSSDSGKFSYEKNYTGIGEYVFTAEDIAGNSAYYPHLHDFDHNPTGTDEQYAGFYASTLEIGIVSTHFPGAYLPADGKFTATFAKTDKPETVVPEPASIAYAALGFASVIGIKRRIKK